MDKLLENLLLLRSAEKSYKHLYENNKGENYTFPMEYEDFIALIDCLEPKNSHIYKKEITPILEEDSFFDKSVDVSVFQHYRYLPAIYHEHIFFEIACVLSGEFKHYLNKNDEVHEQHLKKVTYLF